MGLPSDAKQLANDEDLLTKSVASQRDTVWVLCQVCCTICLCPTQFRNVGSSWFIEKRRINSKIQTVNFKLRTSLGQACAVLTEIWLCLCRAVVPWDPRYNEKWRISAYKSYMKSAEMRDDFEMIVICLQSAKIVCFVAWCSILCFHSFLAPLVMVLRVLRSAHHEPGCSVLPFEVKWFWNDFDGPRVMLGLGTQRSTSGSIPQPKMTKGDERIQQMALDTCSPTPAERRLSLPQLWLATSGTANPCEDLDWRSS